jgi:hypothetical protein
LWWGDVNEDVGYLVDELTVEIDKLWLLYCLQFDSICDSTCDSEIADTETVQRVQNVPQAGRKFSMLDSELIEVLDKFLDSWIGIFEYRFCFDGICQFIMSSKTFEFYARQVIRFCSREHWDCVCMLTWSAPRATGNVIRKNERTKIRTKRNLLSLTWPTSSNQVIEFGNHFAIFETRTQLAW